MSLTNILNTEPEDGFEDMGIVNATIKVYGPRGEAELEAVVDTDATFTKLPKNVAEKVGFVARRTVSVQIASGEFVDRRVGPLEVELEGVRDSVPIAVGLDGEPGVIGYTTLEILGFKVNPTTRKLELTYPIEY